MKLRLMIILDKMRCRVNSKRIYLFLVFCVFVTEMSAQGIKKCITLEEAIQIAQDQSLDAVVERSRLRTAYWQYRNYKADLLPMMKLSGTLPHYNRTVSSYLREDGTYKYVEDNSISENLSLSITQNIPLTGGQLALQSQLERIDQLNGDKRTNYMSVPFNLVFSQPLITANNLKWDKKIEPEKYRQAQQQFAVGMESIALQTITYYFDLLLAKINVEIDKQKSGNSEKLLRIAQGKRERGLISENELLQLRLNYLNASSSLIQSEQIYQQRMFRLRTFLGYNESVILISEIPDECPEIDIKFEEVLKLANENNPLRYEVICRHLESQRMIAQAKADRGFKADVYVSIGFTGNDNDFRQTYKNLKNRESVSLGITIPILNWGKGKGRVELAESQAEINRVQIEKDIQNFEQDVLTAVRQYQEQTRLNEIVRLADTIAQKRYKTAYETFLLGKISVLDLNAAQTEQDNAQRTYISELFSSWIHFYTLRQLTLFDFERRENISYQPEKI